MIVCLNPKNTTASHQLFKLCLVFLNCYMQRAINNNKGMIFTTPRMGCQKKVEQSILVSISSASLPLQPGNTYLRSGVQISNIAQKNIVRLDENKALQSQSTVCVMVRIHNCSSFVHLKKRKLIRGLLSKTNKQKSALSSTQHYDLFFVNSLFILGTLYISGTLISYSRALSTKWKFNIVLKFGSSSYQDLSYEHILILSLNFFFNLRFIV